MAQRRMFSKAIVKSEEFSVMPKSSQALYFHLGMDADDDGFIHPGQIMRSGGYQEDDLKILLAKRFLLTFESGVVVIKHWLIHNLIQKDRHIKTRYQEELDTLFIKENKAYTDNKPIKLLNVNKVLPQVRLGKDRIGEDRIEREEVSQAKPLTQKEHNKAFFESTELQEETITHLSSAGIPETLARQEVNKFVSYWTELNSTGKKQRWELEKTFEVKRRLVTWFSNIRPDFRSKINTNPTWKIWN